MKAVAIAAVTLAAFTPAAAQQRAPDRQVVLPPLPGFVPGNAQRAGRQTMVEFVPQGQTVQRYTKLVTLNTFPVPPGMTADQTLAEFAQRYRVACPRATAAAMDLGGGNRGVRLDCPRAAKTGKPETVFARAVAMNPEMAVVQYLTTYNAQPGEAATARDFLGRVTVR